MCCFHISTKFLQRRGGRGKLLRLQPPNFLLSKNVLKEILFTLQFLNKNWIHFIVVKNIDLVYYKCNSCVYQTLNRYRREKPCECGLAWEKTWKNIQWELEMASKKQTITNFFKPCNKEKPNSETSKSSALLLMVR